MSGNYCSTPDAAANRITGDIEIIAKITLLDTTNDNAIIGKYQGGASTDWLFYTQGKRLKDITVGAIHTSTVDLPYNIGDTFYVKFTRIASTGDIEYFYKTNLTDSWTKLGATVSSTAGNLTAGSATVTVGAYSLGAGFPALTKIYRATISNSIGGAPVVNFDANEFNAATSQSSWTSSTGEVWSIQKDQLNNSAFSGQMVNRTIIVGSGTTYMTGDAGLRGTQDFSVFHCSNSDINAGSPSAGTVFGNYIAGNLQVLTDGKASALYIGLYLNAAEYTTQTQVQNAIYVMGFQRTSGAYTIDYSRDQVETGTNSQTIGTTSNFRIYQNTSRGEG